MEGGAKKPNIAWQAVVDLSKFLKLIDPERCVLRNVSYMANILRFLNKLRADKCGPSGELTKLSTLKTALNMMVSRIPEDSTDEEDRALILRAKVVETRINGIQKTIRKEANAISAQKREFFVGEKVDRGTVIQFLGNERLLQLVKSYIAKEKMTEAEQLLTRRFLMCTLVYMNSQRQGPVVNLQLEEQAQATVDTTRGTTRYIYKVWEHKTCGQFGCYRGDPQPGDSLHLSPPPNTTDGSREICVPDTHR